MTPLPPIDDRLIQMLRVERRKHKDCKMRVIRANGGTAMEDLRCSLCRLSDEILEQHRKKGLKSP